jgi:hypothetical protein
VVINCLVDTTNVRDRASMLGSCCDQLRQAGRQTQSVSNPVAVRVTACGQPRDLEKQANSVRRTLRRPAGPEPGLVGRLGGGRDDDNSSKADDGNPTLAQMVTRQGKEGRG